jgi:hypothetical protein
MWRKTLDSKNRSQALPHVSKITFSVFKRCAWSLCLLLSVILIAFPTDKSYAGAELSIQQVRALLQDMQECEKKLLSLRIEAELSRETKLAPGAEWEQTRESSECTAWFTGGPKGKVRVDVHKQVSEWKDSNGVVRPMEARFSLAFDGEDGKIVTHALGSQGAMRPEKSCRVVSGRPGNLNSSHIQHLTGARFSTFFFFAADEQFDSFSGLLKRALSTPGAAPFRYYREEFLGVECLKIAAGEVGDNRVTYWLDMSHGFALRGYELINQSPDGREWVVSSIRVTKLKEAAPGIWYPAEAVDETSPRKRGLPFERIVFRAKDIAANASDFSDTVFDTRVPDDYRIVDERNQQSHEPEN